MLPRILSLLLAVSDRGVECVCLTALTSVSIRTITSTCWLGGSLGTCLRFPAASVSRIRRLASMVCEGVGGWMGRGWMGGRVGGLVRWVG